MGTIEGVISGVMRGFSKANSSLWVLAGDNTFTPLQANTSFEVQGGALRLAHANALPGGLGATGGTSLLSLNGGVVELGTTDLQRALGTATNQIQFLWNGIGGGFSAHGANRAVNFGGSSATMTWNGGSGAIPTGATLILNSAYANAQIDFQNPINLNGAVRTIRVDDNPATSTDVALLSGLISGTGSSGINKTGAGTLILGAANTYSGLTTVSNGTLLVNGSVAGSVSVAGGTLGGTGTVAGAVSVAEGAAITGGGRDEAGTLTVGSLTIAGDAILHWNYSSTTQDLIVVSGALTLPASGTLNVSPLTGDLLPESGVILAFASGPADGELPGWTVTGTGVKANTRVRIAGNQLVLDNHPRGTLISIQ